MRTITATRLYSPGRWEDGTLTFASSGEVAIPSSLPVTVGNAGNGWARLTFLPYGTPVPIRCSYRGGASTANPTEPADYERGLQYMFARCERYDAASGEWQNDPALVAGTRIEVVSMELSIQSGSNRYPTREAPQTTVTLETQITPITYSWAPDVYTILVFDAEDNLFYYRTEEPKEGNLNVCFSGSRC